MVSNKFKIAKAHEEFYIIPFGNFDRENEAKNGSNQNQKSCAC
jgi:hypothetical protein